MGGKFRQRNPLLVVDEIEFWKDRYRVRDFTFYDDALMEDPSKHITPLLKEVIKRKLKVNFHSPNGLNIRKMSKDLAILIHDAGFKTVRLSLESADKERQKNIGNKATNEEFQEAVTNLRKAGFLPYQIGAYLLTGLPGQEFEEVERSIDFILKSKVMPLLAEYSPLPGTTLWEEAIKASPFNISKEPLFHNNSILPCQSEFFTPTHLNQLKHKIKEKVKSDLRK